MSKKKVLKRPQQDEGMDEFPEIIREKFLIGKLLGKGIAGYYFKTESIINN
jgi:hypothetical protein